MGLTEMSWEDMLLSPPIKKQQKSELQPIWCVMKNKFIQARKHHQERMCQWKCGNSKADVAQKDGYENMKVIKTWYGTVIINKNMRQITNQCVQDVHVQETNQIINSKQFHWKQHKYHHSLDICGPIQDMLCRGKQYFSWWRQPHNDTSMTNPIFKKANVKDLWVNNTAWLELNTARTV